MLLSTLGWHSIFLVMVVYGIVALLVMGFWCVETNVAPNLAQAYPGQILRNYAMLLRDSGFMRGSLVLGCAVGAFYTMAVILPFVLMEKIGLTPTQFGLMMLAQTGSYALGAAVTGRLLRRIEVMRLVPIGLIPHRLQEAGCFALVLEGIPAELAARVTQSLSIPTIGIGAGPDCSGQVLVLHDVLGLSQGHRPKFVRTDVDGFDLLQRALTHWAEDVRRGAFPSPAESYALPADAHAAVAAWAPHVSIRS